MGVKGKIGYSSESDLKWKDKRLDYASGDLDYAGFSETINAATDAGNSWMIWKYTWSGNGLVRSQGPLNGNWDDRASLGWV